MKFLGLILLFAGCTAWGWMRSIRLGEDVRFWEQFLGFALYAENTLRCMSLPTGELLCRYEAMRPGFEPVHECVQRWQAGNDLPDAWADGIQYLREAHCLPEDSPELLLEFGAGLGTTDLTGQLSHIAMYRLMAEEKRTSARKAQERKAKMYIVLGAALGLGLDLLLL